MTDTIAVRQGEELNLPRLERYLRDNIALPDQFSLEIRQFGTGASNLTYLIQAGEWEAVLRRPPLGPIPPKAHDMAREYKILSKLHPVFPLAPKPYVFCENEEIIGSPFLIMERRKGIVLDTEFPDEINPTAELCQKISEAMLDTLVQLHNIDYQQTGLDEIGRPAGFMKRQVNGWIERYERSKTDEIAGLENVKKWLSSHLPESPKPTIIHYDYKLNNVMFSEHDFTKMVGVFDWEMTTIGDPLADLGCVLSYWVLADDPDVLKTVMGKPPVSILPGFWSRDQFTQAYAVKSGRDVSQINFYLAFAYFKLSVISQQIFFRWKRGQTTDERFASFGGFTRSLIAIAREFTQ